MTDTISCPRCSQEYHGAEPACPACGQFAAPTNCARHPDRTAPGRCVICGDPVCDVCDEGDRTHYSCPDHHDVPVVAGWAQIYTTSDDVEASLIRENLQADGIDAEVLSQKDRTFALEVGDLSGVRLLVPAYEYQRARDVIAAHMDAAGEVSFACPQCGEAYDHDATVCASCGASLD